MTGAATLTFIVAQHAAVGTYPVIVSAVGTVIQRSLSFSLQILPGGGVTIAPAGNWTALFGWFLAVIVIAAAVIYLIERRKRWHPGWGRVAMAWEDAVAEVLMGPLSGTLD